MSISTRDLPWSLSKKLLAILEVEMQLFGIDASVGAILTFRDPSYSAESGGYHPVEIAVGPGGHVEYITDFACVGIPPFCELAKEIDFDFSLGLFQQLGIEYPICKGKELFRLWERNFTAYYHMGVYTVAVEAMG